MTIFESIYFWILTVSSFLTIALQAVTIYLILYHSPKNMTRYRPFIMLSIIYDMLFTIVIGFLLQGYPSGPESNPVIMFSGLLVWMFHVEGARFGIGLFYGGFALVGTGQTVCLIYRYLVFHTKRQNLFHFTFGKNRIRFIHFLLYLFVAAIAYFGATELPLAITDADGLTGVYLVSQHQNPDTVKFIVTIVCLLLAWEILYFVIVMRILQLLKPKIATFSPNTIRLHRQLTFLLLGQAISPLICLVAPVFLAALDKMIADKSFGYLRIQASFLMTVAHMAISSILTIGFVQPYRTKFKKAIVKVIVCLRIRVIATDQTHAAVISISNNTHSQTI